MEAAWAGDVWGVLGAHPDTAAHCGDPRFRLAIDAIRADPTLLRRYLDDPRVVQASALLLGQEVVVTEADLAAAERGGRIPRRSPVLPAHREGAARHTDPRAAKEAGNGHLQAGESGLALACYDRCIELLPTDSQHNELRCVAHSNAAAVYLKLQLYKEAEAAAGAALSAAPPEGPPAQRAKPLYRRAQAREHLGPTPRAHPDEAVADLRQALDLLLLPGGGHSGEAQKVAADLRRLEQEVARRQRLHAEEAQAAALRQTGAVLSAAKATSSAPRTDGSVKETDYSYTARKRLRAVLAGVYTSVKGCRVSLKEMVDAQTKISVSVMSKRGERALFYDFDILYSWEGSSKKGRDTEGTLGGYLRLYNIGQDTRFEPGGLPETCWMYTLGFRPEDQASAEPWAEDIRTTANDLFEPVALRIRVLIKELEKY